MCYACSGSYTNGGGSSGGYSPLESTVSYQSASYNSSSGYSSMDTSELEMMTEQAPVMSNYSTKQYVEAAYLTNQNVTQSYASMPHQFINPGVVTKFIGKADEIKDYIEQAFKATTGNEFPDNMSIRICGQEELKQIFEANGGKWNLGIQGFAINRPGVGNIFVKESDLAKVMLTIGHEIGHCLSAPLNSKHDEEAKAFAFEIAWMKALHESNIAELKNAINPNMPAKNGLHNVAFDFVRNVLKTGIDAIDVFKSIIHGDIKCQSI